MGISLPGQPGKKLDAQFLFQVKQAVIQCGTCDIKFFCGMGDVLFLCYSDDIIELFKIHRAPPFYRCEFNNTVTPK